MLPGPAIKLVSITAGRLSAVSATQARFPVELITSTFVANIGGVIDISPEAVLPAWPAIVQVMAAGPLPGHRGREATSAPLRTASRLPVPA